MSTEPTQEAVLNPKPEGEDHKERSLRAIEEAADVIGASERAWRKKSRLHRWELRGVPAEKCF